MRGTISATSSRRRRGIDIAWVLGGVGILLLSGAFARGGTVPEWEQAVFRGINGLPSWLEPPMRTVEILGVLAIGPIVAAIALAFRRTRLAAAAILATGGKLIFERVVKLIVERQRPAVSTPGTIARGVPLRGLAFVSGHAVLTAALSGVASPYLRRWWKVIPWTVLTLVCFARVYLGAHNPLDVVGGAGLGLAIAGILNLALGVPVEDPPLQT